MKTSMESEKQLVKAPSRQTRLKQHAEELRQIEKTIEKIQSRKEARELLQKGAGRHTSALLEESISVDEQMLAELHDMKHKLDAEPSRRGLTIRHRIRLIRRKLLHRLKKTTSVSGADDAPQEDNPDQAKDLDSTTENN